MWGQGKRECGVPSPPPLQQAIVSSLLIASLAQVLWDTGTHKEDAEKQSRMTMVPAAIAPTDSGPGCIAQAGLLS